MIVSLLKTLLLFGFVGPLIGLCCVVAQDPAAFGAVLPGILVLLSFVTGLIPAVTTGLVAWSLRFKLPRYLGGLVCGAIGAMTSVLALLPLSEPSWESVFRLGIVPGGIAGFICGLLYFWPPNNSFKPKPLRGSA
jgi:hypothetical protein